MNNSVIGKNVAPGMYFKETEVGYSAKSLGITTAGLAGETLKGPAFEHISIADWGEFETVFGGTSTEKFKDSLYPKYELPFIAKSYLAESKQLEVVRVLGLSGYNAGPAWYIKDNSGKIIAVIRSRGHYVKYSKSTDAQGCVTYGDYDKLVFDAVSIALKPYSTTSAEISCNTSNVVTEISYFAGGQKKLSASDYGKFVIEVTGADGQKESYSVSLNAGDKDYILTILGTKPNDASALVFVEELYDVALGQSIADGTSETINQQVTLVKGKKYYPVCDPVSDLLSIGEDNLRRINLNQTFLVSDATEAAELLNDDSLAVAGKVLKVVYDASASTYAYEDANVTWTVPNSAETNFENTAVVYVNSLGAYFGADGKMIRQDVNNYKERFRSAVTPWFVSQLLGNGKSVDVKRLFRFVTISDGNSANEEVKVSIEKIYPDEGLFDVVVRDYADSDLAQNVLERFVKCSLEPSASSFIAKKIGTADGEFELKSNYIMVDLADDDTIYGLVPCGFLGYPLRDADAFDLKYNTTFDSDIRPRKQYFGMSDIVGVDIDVLRYKGVTAYNDAETKANFYSNGFHLDSRALPSTAVTLTVNGETGYTFSCVSANSYNSNGSTEIPVVTNEVDMASTIYEDVNLRKFTAYPYGGFDGWDDYRGKRTNTDDFKINKYKGTAKNGEYENFTMNFNKTGLGLEDIKAMTSDYYAFLAGYRQFANPEGVDINLFASPGIDIINNTLLVDEVINILEDEEDGRNGDSLYVVTTPDKPSGASDAEDDMYTPDEVAELIKDTTISDSYVATYYPWVKYFDQPSETYIMLPVTKDALRDFAHVDNTSAPWFAAAGTKNGNGDVNCVKAHKNLKRQDENVLYENFINPVKTFAQDGVKIWGNKTLYFNDESPLNRINVRRLMLRVKKLMSTAGRVLIFDLNDGTLEKQFRSIVEPILADVKSNRGIFDYRLDVLNSDECDDEHRLNCKIWIKPTPTMEQIGIEFMVTPKCVSFVD